MKFADKFTSRKREACLPVLWFQIGKTYKEETQT